jgi:hypothetical protein
VCISNVGTLGPVFVDGTVTSDVYRSLLTDEFVPFLMGYGIPMNSTWCSRGGVRPPPLALKPLGLVSVELCEKKGLSEISSHSSGTENCHPIRV